MFSARLINPFEGGRWRLRRMRANGYGNSIFSPIGKKLVFQYFKNEHRASSCYQS
jgi:hypothetical protein